MGAPFGGTTRGAHQGFDSDAFALITPPYFGAGGGSCFPLRVVVALGEPGSPATVCATAGDPKASVYTRALANATIAEREQCWFHVDAAYGGFFLLTDHGRTILRGIERSDSVVLDPHKSLFLPYGSGVVLVRNVEHLLATNTYHASYMQDAVRSPGEISPEDV